MTDGHTGEEPPENPDEPGDDDNDPGVDGTAFISLLPMMRALEEQQRKIVKATAIDLTRIVPPLLRFEIPEFVDITPIGRSLSIAMDMAEVVRALLEPITEASRRAISGVLHQTLAGLVDAERFYPANLRDARLDANDLEQLLIEEGIPLMWVPRAQTVSDLRDAPDRAARRRIIGSRWKGIITDCTTVLDSITHPDLKADTDYVFEATDALRNGYTNAAQALATNLGDTFNRHLLDEEMPLINPKNAAKLSLDNYAFRVVCTLGPLSHARAKYDFKKDPVPRVFNRHASAHSVSPAQYSRINAVIALMMATSMLKYFDTRH